MMVRDDELTVPQAAELLGINRNTLLQAIARGRIPARRLGGKLWLLTRADVDEYARTRRARPPRAKA